MPPRDVTKLNVKELAKVVAVAQRASKDRRANMLLPPPEPLLTVVKELDGWHTRVAHRASPVQAMTADEGERLAAEERSRHGLKGWLLFLPSCENHEASVLCVDQAVLKHPSTPHCLRVSGPLPTLHVLLFFLFLCLKNKSLPPLEAFVAILFSGLCLLFSGL